MAARNTHALAGFTLVEALVVVAIVAILAMLAVPSFSSLVESQRADATANDLGMALTRTRSEAVKQNANATLASKAGGNWASGWQILDPNTNAVIDDHGAVTGLTLTGPANVVYQSSGRVQGGVAPSFSITGSYTNSAHCVSADLSGRPLIKKGSC